MSKINATYSSGYYIAPDVDFRKLEEQQRQEQRGKRRKPGADSGDGNSGDDNVKRQTFAIPFDLICLHCHHRIARGSHVYTNRRATEERYLDSIRIWELEILCRFCKGKYYLRTDPETPKDTGGYICVKGCKRVEGDFYDLNKQNQATREAWEQAKADAELDPLAALEKENEAARQLEQRNRQIEEEVEQQAGHSDSDLLAMLRNRPRRRAESGHSSAEDEDHADDTPAVLSSSAPPGFPPPPPKLGRADPDGSGGSDDGDDDGNEGEDADERSFREFEEDMERRWRALEREQRAQRRKAQESTTTQPTVQAGEVDRVLARYGSARRAAPPTTEGDTTPAMSAPSARTVPGSSTLTEVNTSAETTSSVSAATTASAHRNKFLVDDDDDDGDGMGISSNAPWQRVQLPMATRPVTSAAPSVSVSSSPSAARQGVAAPLPSPSAFTSGLRTGGNALLRNLVDSDSDDEAD